MDEVFKKRMRKIEVEILKGLVCCAIESRRALSFLPGHNLKQLQTLRKQCVREVVGSYFDGARFGQTISSIRCTTDFAVKIMVSIAASALSHRWQRIV